MKNKRFDLRGVLEEVAVFWVCLIAVVIAAEVFAIIVL